MRFTAIVTVILLVSVIGFTLAAFGSDLPVERIMQDAGGQASVQAGNPPVIMQMGDTTWIQVHTDASYCPGDPNAGHGGEATGGPDGSETWCLEGNGGAGDSCGTLPPYNVNCLVHRDMRIQPSDLGINYWHVDTYRADEETYCGNYSLWCGSDALWEGAPVECGSWGEPAPGYGNNWNCIAELTLPPLFSYAGGCHVRFDTRYETECNYDFLYIEYFNGGTWENLASFCAISDNYGPSCTEMYPTEPTMDYFNNSDDDIMGPPSPAWETRSVAGVPAFSEFIPPEDLASATGFSWIELEQQPELFRHDAAYDSNRGRIVIYGGASYFEPGPTYENDTYEWDDSTWVSLFPAANPGERGGHQMVYFPAGDYTLLFGGEDETDLFSDTWAWDGTDWTELSPAHSPQARHGHGMTYDSARGVIVLFGGEGNTGYRDDTWEWNGVDWVRRLPLDSPAARTFLGANGLAYDPTRGVTMLFGGYGGGSDAYRSTWEWDGTNWTSIGPVTRPRARYMHGLAYHPNLGGIILYGGLGGDGLDEYVHDTWLWDGADWTELYPGVSAGRIASFAMTYDYSIGRMILHGGTRDGEEPEMETWKLDYGDPLRLRWRFVSDMFKSDANDLDTDGAAWIDNVEVDNNNETFTQDFESGTTDPAHWSFPDHEGVVDGWHMVHDPDPLYEGGDGGYAYDCRMDSSVVFKARPEGGYPVDAPWRNSWFYSLMTPGIPIQNTGCVVQYDMHWCSVEYTCDYINTRVRFYDEVQGTWCPWIDPNGCALVGNCSYWNTDWNEDLTTLYGTAEDSLQFAWEFIDVSRPSDFCRGKHIDSDLHVDNISVGFFDSHVTQFTTRPIDLLHDTFNTGICGYNSFFNECNSDTTTHYTGGTPLPRGKQFNVDVVERDGITSVELLGTINEGGSWITNSMTLDTVYDPLNPDWGGTYYGTFCPADFALGEWDEGTDFWYCVKVTDDLAQVEYFPAAADPAHPGHTGLVGDYLDYSILSHYPPEYTEPRILLVNGAAYDAYDPSACTGSGAVKTVLVDLYGLILEEAGYTYERFDILGSGWIVQIQPHTEILHYDAVIWITDQGDNTPGSTIYRCPFKELSQFIIINGIHDQEGKFIIIGDRIAQALADPAEGGGGCDSLYGTFLNSALGVDYIGEMASPLDEPYIECDPEATVEVDGTTIPVDLDTLTIFRGCPQYRKLSSITATTTGTYDVQPLLSVVDPDVPDARMAIYVESELFHGGKCTFFNFDFAGTGYCGGSAPAKSGPSTLDEQDGRVALLRFVLEDLYGLPPSTSGVNRRPDLPGRPETKWALHQNLPNPCRGGTEIRYDVAEFATVRINVYSPTGRLVRTLVNRRVKPGEHVASWNGTNSSGRQVADGIYFYKMETGRFRATRKMLLLK